VESSRVVFHSITETSPLFLSIPTNPQALYNAHLYLTNLLHFTHEKCLNLLTTFLYLCLFNLPASAYECFRLIAAQNHSWPCANYKIRARRRTESARTAAHSSICVQRQAAYLRKTRHLIHMAAMVSTAIPLRCSI
jgi:hypothetical protein